jgi:hypothetical protein
MLKRRIALILLPLLAVVCSPISSILPGASSSFDHPLDVQVTLDSEHSVTQTVTPDGGTLEATGQDGTHYTLTIPKDALLYDVDITMTPASGIDNLPLSNKSLAAVQLAPEGLNLLEPATLVIEAATPIPVKELVSFAYLGDGKDLHLFPLNKNPADTTFQILHFSGYGTGQGNSGNLQKYPPGSGESNADAQGTDIMKNVWLNHGGDFTDEDAAQLCKVLLDWYDASVISDLKAAETDSSRLYAAGGQFMRWSKQVDMFCYSSSALDAAVKGGYATVEAKIEAGKQSLARGLEHAYHEASPPQCDVKLMYQWSKWAALLSLLSYAPDLTWDPDVKEDIEKCQVFELEIGGSMTLTGRNTVTHTIPKGTVPLKRTGPGSFAGSNELDAEYSISECVWTGQPQYKFTVQAENSDELVHQGSIFDFSIDKVMTWTGTMTCPDNNKTYPFSLSFPHQISFKLPALDGAQYEWKSPSGLWEGTIYYTIRDPKGYLDEIGKANWQSS